MAGTIQCGRRVRKDFGKIPSIVEIPNLIEVQKRSYEAFLQKDVAPDRREEAGLQGVFRSVFPIEDYNGNARLEFDSYHFGDPKYTVEECHDRGMTFAIPLKVTLRLVVYDQDKESKTKTIREQRGQEVYLGELPLMTDKGTFIINGTERVVVSQLQRSAGVFFDDDKGKTLASGRSLFSARVIPYRGSWVEFDFDANELLHVRVDRRRKMHATAFLRAFWFLEKGIILSDEEILAQFYEMEDVLSFEEGTVWVTLHRETHVGARLADDIRAPRHREALAQAGKPLTAKLVEKLVEAGVEKIPLRAESLVGRRTGGRIVDTESGEVLAETNAEITSAVLQQIMSRRVAPFKLLVLSPGKMDASLYETLARDHVKNPDEALVEIYKKLRPGDPPTVESARALFRGMFIDARRYDLARVGRFMINKKLAIDAPAHLRTLRGEDIVAIIRHLMMVRLGSKAVDDIDHLGNRRVRSVGELLENQFRVGLTRMERAVKERMSISDIQNLMPHDLINAKPVSAVVKEFFGSSQLSQFMDQTNPLAELTHKRRLSALGSPRPQPGARGLRGAGRAPHPLRAHLPHRDAGGAEHRSHLVAVHLRADQRVRLHRDAVPQGRGRAGHRRDRVPDRPGGRAVHHRPGQRGHRSRPGASCRSASRPGAAASSGWCRPRTSTSWTSRPSSWCRWRPPSSPSWRTTTPTAPSWAPTCSGRPSPSCSRRPPWWGRAWSTSWPGTRGRSMVAKRPGVVEYVSADRIVVRAESRSKKADPVQDLPLDIYNLTKYRRSNQNTCINQKAIVQKGQRVQAGDVIADGPATDQGELALGRNVLVAFMPWGGYNFEDAILVSERLIKEDRFTSIHIEEFEIQARDTKLGKEEITRDIPNVSEEALKDLDDSGIVRIGAKLKPGDIMVGKITPKGETQLTPEEKLLRAIFGEKAGDVRDTSLTVPPGIEGTVVDVKVFSRRGVDKDERAKSIEEEEIGRLEKDYQDEIAMVEMERDQKLKNLLVGKTARPRPLRSHQQAESAGQEGRPHRARRPRQLRLERPQEDPDQGGRGARPDHPPHRGAGRGADRPLRHHAGGAHRPAPPRGRPAPGRHQDGQGLRGGEAQALRGRQDGRAPRQQGRGGQGAPRGGHAVPGRRHPRGDRPQPPRGALAHERGADPRDAPGLGGPGPRAVGGQPRLRRRHRGRDQGAPGPGRLPALGQGGALRRPQRQALPSGGDRRPDLHAQAGPPRRRQDARALHRPLLPGHPAAAGRQGPVRRPALRRDGGVGAGSVRSRPTPCRRCSPSSPTTWRAATGSTRPSSRARTSWSPAPRSRSTCSSRSSRAWPSTSNWS